MSERIQSLLSRAVEDQLSEQRQLADALGDVRAHLSRLGEELAALRAGPGNGDDALLDGRLGSLTTELRDTGQLTSDRLEDVVRLVSQRGEDLAGIRESLAEVEEKVRAQGDALAGLTGALASLPSYGDRVAALADNLDAVQQRLDAQAEARDDRLAAVERFLSQLGPMLGEVGEASHENGESLAELAQRFDRFDEALAQREPTASPQAQQRLDAMNQSLQGRLAAMQVDVTAIGASLAGLVESSIDRTLMQSATDSMDSAATRLDAVDELWGEVRDLRLAVMGPDGVAARLRTTEAAIEASEQRLASHVDDAVLALAEALLRRRPASADLDDQSELDRALSYTPDPPRSAPAFDAGPVDVGPVDVGPIDVRSVDVLSKDVPLSEVTSAGARAGRSPHEDEFDQPEDAGDDAAAPAEGLADLDEDDEAVAEDDAFEDEDEDEDEDADDDRADEGRADDEAVEAGAGDGSRKRSWFRS